MSDHADMDDGPRSTEPVRGFFYGVVVSFVIMSCCAGAVWLVTQDGDVAAIDVGVGAIALLGLWFAALGLSRIVGAVHKL